MRRPTGPWQVARRAALAALIVLALGCGAPPRPLAAVPAATAGTGTPDAVATSPAPPAPATAVPHAATALPATATSVPPGTGKGRALPQPRANAALATDALDGYTVLFGGFAGSNLADTWSFDGSTWTPRPGAGPPARNGAAAAYDPGRGQIVLFGGAGNGASNFLSDTWTWSRGRWTQQHPAQAPPVRRDAAFAWDAQIGALLLFGGTGMSGALADTWAWDGAAWKAVLTAHSPAARWNGILVAAGTKLELVGGDARPQLAGWPDPWAFDGTDWTPVTTSGSAPPPRFAAVGAGLPGTSTAVLFGGASDTTGSLADTWLLTGTTWSRAAGPQPGPRTAASERPAATLSSLQGNQVLLFGGHVPVRGIADNTPGYLNDTWAFDGTAWRQLA